MVRADGDDATVATAASSSDALGNGAGHPAGSDAPVATAAPSSDALGNGSGHSAASAITDDEYARELALTLVDLLSEYQDPDVPLGNGTTPDPGPDVRSDGRAPSSRGGVPTARRADDAGPRLADLLADAMDAYHSTGPDPVPAEGRRAPR